MLKRTFRAIGIEKCKPLKIFCQPGLLSKIQANFWTRKTANKLHSGTAFVNVKILSEFGRTCRAEVRRRRIASSARTNLGLMDGIPLGFGNATIQRLKNIAGRLQV